MKFILPLLMFLIMPVQAKYWAETNLYYYIDPEILEAEPLVRQDIYLIAEIPMSINLIPTSKRTGSDIRLLVHNEIDTIGKTNFVLKYSNPEEIAVANCYINMDKMSLFQEINYSNGLRNICRHEFLHALLCVHDRSKPNCLMNPNLSTDKVYWTKRDKKQLRELYPLVE